MTRLKTRVKVIAATAIVSAVAAVGALATSGNFEAKADDGNYVSFGDSIPSNPTQIQLSAQANDQLRSQLNIPEVAPGHCALGKDNFPNRIGHDTGIETNNYACAASPAAAEHPHNFRAQVDAALHEGKLNNKTRLVSVFFGFNDVYQDANLPFEEHKALFVNTMADQINRVRQAAPNARIVVGGYPDLTDGNNNICPTNLFGVAGHVYGGGWAPVQDFVRDWQRSAAEKAGVPYLDMMAEINAANNNNGCTDNPHRLSASLVDDQEHNLWGHLTADGNQFYADKVRSYMA